MNLYEYQAKKLLLKFQLPVLKNWFCSDVSKINHCISNITSEPPWVVKCQIYSGGRGKSGGVLLVSSKEEILIFAKKWIGQPLVTHQTSTSGEIVNSILIEPAIKILRELYLSILIDRDSSQIIFMASAKGGINIENLISESPQLLYKIAINPISCNTHSYEGRIIAYKLGLKGIQIHQFSDIYVNIIHMFLEKDLTLIEINPLVITHDNHLICLDAKITVDHNALFRQSQLLDLCKNTNKRNNVTVFDSFKSNYISLDGNIGCMVNGAGLAMATMDLMRSLGGSPANFLDIGGDTHEDGIISALKTILQNKQVRAIFVNIFGGIVCCELVARSIIIAVSQCSIIIPIVVRLEGNNADLGSNKLISSGLNIIVINNLIYAIQKVIMLVNKDVYIN